jgi:SAM-dependent methyltransferase
MNTQKYTIPSIRKNLGCGFDPNNLASGREPCQMGWYDMVSTMIQQIVGEDNSEKNILDVGCGMCNGIKKMREKMPNNYKVYGQDIDYRLSNLDENFLSKDVSQFDDKSFDFITCFDVIEHEENDLEFFNHLQRICKNYIFITTPNYTRSKAQNYCHCREYTIPQFFNHFSPDEMWVGTPDGAYCRTKILQKISDTKTLDLTRINTFYEGKLNEETSFAHFTNDGHEWPHYLGIFKC